MAPVQPCFAGAELMSEDEQPGSPPPQRSAPAERPAGRIPFTQEFDRGRRTMPAALPVVIAFAAVAIVVALIVFFNRSKPSAAGTMTKVASAAIQDDGVMVAIQIKFDNTTGERLWIKSIKSELETADGQKYSDDAAPSSDMERYLQAFPVLAESRVGALQEEMKIPPR